MKRFFGKIENLSYTGKQPRIIESKPGYFEHIGSFETAGSFLQKSVLNFCVPFLFCKKLYYGKKSDLSEDEFQTASRLLMDIEKMYKEQFQVEQFIIAWCGNHEYLPRLKKNTSVNIIRFDPKSKFYDGHPKADAWGEFINYLFANKIIK